MLGARDPQRLGEIFGVDPIFRGHVPDPTVFGLVFPKTRCRDHIHAGSLFKTKGRHGPLKPGPQDFRQCLAPAFDMIIADVSRRPGEAGRRVLDQPDERITAGEQGSFAAEIRDVSRVSHVQFRFIPAV
jgi:hypothetical protein